MSRIKLPNSLDTYLAFQEDDRTGDFRRFHLFLPYKNGARIERLHWEWKVTGTEEATIGAKGVEEKNARERARFARHVERWLQDSKSVLHGNAPIPELRKDDDA